MANPFDDTVEEVNPFSSVVDVVDTAKEKTTEVLSATEEGAEEVPNAVVDAAIEKGAEIAKSFDEVVDEVIRKGGLETGVTNPQRSAAAYLLTLLALGGTDYLTDVLGIDPALVAKILQLSPLIKAVKAGSSAASEVPIEIWVGVAYIIFRRWGKQSDVERIETVLSEITRGQYDMKADVWKKAGAWNKLAHRLAKRGVSASWQTRIIRGGPYVMMAYFAYAWRSEIWGAGKAVYDFFKHGAKEEDKEQLDKAIHDGESTDNTASLTIDPDTGEVTVDHRQPNQAVVDRIKQNDPTNPYGLLNRGGFMSGYYNSGGLSYERQTFLRRLLETVKPGSRDEQRILDRLGIRPGGKNQGEYIKRTKRTQEYFYGGGLASTGYFQGAKGFKEGLGDVKIPNLRHLSAATPTPVPSTQPQTAPKAQNCAPGYVWDAQRQQCVPVRQEDPTSTHDPHRQLPPGVTAKTGWSSNEPQLFEDNSNGVFSGAINGLNALNQAAFDRLQKAASEPGAIKFELSGPNGVSRGVLHQGLGGGIVITGIGAYAGQSIAPSAVLDNIEPSNFSDLTSLQNLDDAARGGAVGALFEKGRSKLNEYLSEEDQIKSGKQERTERWVQKLSAAEQAREPESAFSQLAASNAGNQNYGTTTFHGEGGDYSTGARQLGVSDQSYAGQQSAYGDLSIQDVLNQAGAQGNRQGSGSGGQARSGEFVSSDHDWSAAKNKGDYIETDELPEEVVAWLNS